MRAIEIRGGFGLDRLALVERPTPVAGPGQVVLRMRAAALNFRDLLMAEGRYNPRQPLPLVPCSDGVGEVVETGPGVERVRPGERVLPIFAQRWIAGRPARDRLRSTLGGPLDGTLAEMMVAEAEGVVHAPAKLSDVQAATLPCAGVTAWAALTEHTRVGPGDVVLVEGTGGVSIFALQLGQLLGARVIVTSSSEAKLERARTLGAWATIHYPSTPEWGKEVRRLTDGEGVDVVLDVGGASTLGQAVEAVRFGGCVCLVGNVTGSSHALQLPAVFMRQLRLQGVLVGPRESLETLVRAVEARPFEPVIDRVFRLEEAREALEHLRAGSHMGKVCIGIA
jgi:NADPH:quinone reductase-like Zn-dependent oxidoreductase